ncbi:transcriptional regulator [Photobacterium aquae]|uniref:Transcriptional regulator n=1 Tax=Photobacterium aquae TaxID=1195763 RepID=A0A0J1GUD3_9GAMM|nr:nuclear transport factor 2 family protein [Photobacterium aquae]KLV03340.1 transcriptional regulator [Photobacterium aquae]
MSYQPKELTEKFVQAYRSLSKENVAMLEDVYHQDVVFEDPAHRMEGWQNLEGYFDRLFENVSSCAFDIHETVEQGNVAYVQWTMHFSHPRISNGEIRQVKGCSRLEFAEGKVQCHRDYFDMGEMIYEGIPLLGNVVRHLKARL